MNKKDLIKRQIYIIKKTNNKRNYYNQDYNYHGKYKFMD